MHGHDPQLVVLGAHNLANYHVTSETGRPPLFAAHMQDALPAHTVFFNFEPIMDNVDDNDLVRLYKPFTVWEYSRHNYERLRVSCTAARLFD